MKEKFVIHYNEQNISGFLFLGSGAFSADTHYTEINVEDHPTDYLIINDFIKSL
jgi:hypothetical protein